VRYSITTPRAVVRLSALGEGSQDSRPALCDTFTRPRCIAILHANACTMHEWADHKTGRTNETALRPSSVAKGVWSLSRSSPHPHRSLSSTFPSHPHPQRSSLSLYIPDHDVQSTPMCLFSLQQARSASLAARLFPSTSRPSVHHPSPS
jgi:hypothetical protein